MRTGHKFRPLTVQLQHVKPLVQLQVIVRDHDDVQLLLEQGVQDFLPSPLPQVDGRLGVELPELPEVAGNALLGVGSVDAQAEVLLLAVGNGPGLLHRPVVLGQNALTLAGKILPRRGQRHRRAPPVKQLKAQFFLKLLDLLADGRLCHIAFPGSLGKIQVFGHR